MHIEGHILLKNSSKIQTKVIPSTLVRNQVSKIFSKITSVLSEFIKRNLYGFKMFLQFNELMCEFWLG